MKLLILLLKGLFQMYLFPGINKKTIFRPFILLISNDQLQNLTPITLEITANIFLLHNYILKHPLSPRYI